MSIELEWQSPGLAGLDLLRVKGMIARVPKHVHTAWCLLAVENGQRFFGLAGRELSVRQGQAIVIPPGMVHECWGLPGQACDYRVFTLSTDLLENLLKTKLSTENGPWLWPDPNRELAGIHAKIMSGWDTELAGNLLAQLATAIKLSVGSSLPGPGSTRTSQAVARAKAILDSARGQGLALDELARRVGLSPYYLSRRFSQEVGVPPHAYLTLSRLRQARGLLAQGWPLADTALASGFYDQSHFCLRFKQYMGISPGQLKRGKV